MAKKKAITQVNILIKDITQNKYIEKGLLADRLSDKIFVFMDINYKLGIPTWRKETGQKKQISYKYWWENDNFFSTSNTNEVRRTPKRPVFKIHGNEYKMFLQTNDDFYECLDDLAKVLVESQGEEIIHKKERIEKTPNLEIKYKSSKLEKELKRL